MKPILLKILIIFLSLSFSGCGTRDKYDSDLLIGSWRECRHGEWDFDDRYAMTISLNSDNTFKMYMPWNRYSFSGTWNITNDDTTTLLVLKNDLSLDTKSDYMAFQEEHYNEDYRRYYFFRINNAEKGKLYLTDVTTTEAYMAAREFLLKPQE